MAVAESGSVVGFRRMIELLVMRTRGEGLLVAPGAGAADIDELVRVAVARSLVSADGRVRTYTALLMLASLNGAPLPIGSWERVGQIWEAYGGTWGGRMSPEMRGAFVWTSRG